MNILFVCGEAPTAAHPRPHGLIAALSRRGHSVTLLFADEAGTAFDDLAERCQQVLPVRRRSLRAAVAREAARGGYDLAHVDRSAASHMPAVPPLPTVLDAGTCRSCRQERSLRSLRLVARAFALARLPLLRRRERELLARFERAIVATPDDAAGLAALRGADAGHGGLHVVPTPVDLRRLAPPTRLRDSATLLLDLRGLTRAESSASLATMARVMPLLWAQRADTRLTVLGHTPFGVASGLAGDPRVVLAGPVHDPRGHLSAATMVVAPFEPPTRLAHGPLEALATATALVTRRRTAQELDARPGEELLVADTPAEIARATTDLLNDPLFRGGLGRAGRRLAERRHGHGPVLSALEDVYCAATGSVIAEWRLEVGMSGARADEL